ncbi:MAG TPA: hypothetical protein VD972_27075, partial [Hyalangium sp.]|nr:hypothetical protein [Hyalangium sp.]
GSSETCESIDTVLELVAADGTTILSTDDDGGINRCSSIDPSVDGEVRRLPAGTYFARVTAYSETIPAYSLFIRYVALCGDGAVTGSEECDGTVNCTATCERVQVCGDGHLDFPESCEDGNTTNGDGCSSTCSVPGLQGEVEPNNTHSEADARAGGSQPVLITGATGFSSTLATASDVDVYKMQLQAPQVVRLESYKGGLGRCMSGLDSILWLENTDRTLRESDDDGGLGLCPALTLSLEAGAYYVSMERLGGDQVESYLLEVAFQSNAGTESEGNDTRASANPLSGPDSVISGSIPATTDADYFRLSVTQGQSIRAEIIEGGTKSCSDSEMESELALFNEAGTELVSDTFGGQGSCSMINGRDFWYSEAGNLPAGNYYLRVRSRPDAAAGKETFDYRLSVTLR